MSQLGGLINIVIGVVMLFVSYSWLSDYFVGDQQKIDKLENLLSSGVETVGIVDSMYSELSIKGAKIYSSKYTFTVGNKSYTESFNFDSPEELMPIVTVYYMADDPNINASNVEQELAKKKEGKDDPLKLGLGIVVFLVGLFFIYFRGVKRFTKTEVVESRPQTQSGNAVDDDFV